MISKLDFVGIPSQDAERSRRFYVDTLGLRPDEHGQSEVWIGETCFGIWEPERLGLPFAPQKNAHPALHVDDVAAARTELESKGVEFVGEILDTGVCHMAFCRPRRQQPDAAPPLRALRLSRQCPGLTGRPVHPASGP